MVSSVLLPDPLGPMTATSSPASTARSTLRSAWTSVGSLAVDLGNLSQLQRHSSARPPPSSEASAERRWPPRPPARAPPRLMRPSAASSHRITESSRNSSASTTRAKLRSPIGFVLLETGPLLHQLDQVPAVHLDHLVHVDAG